MPEKQKRLDFTDRASAEFDAALFYIGLDSPASAELVRKRVNKVIALIAENPDMGTPGKLAGTRDWPVAKTSLTVTYCVMPSLIRILRVRHQSRRYP